MLLEQRSQGSFKMSYPVTSDKGKKRSSGVGHDYSMPTARSKQKAGKIAAAWKQQRPGGGTGSPIEKIGGRK